MSDAKKPTQIQITKNGPYIVKPAVPLTMQTIATNAEGASTEWEEGRAFEAGEQYALCRCGHSNKKPFCDGTHARIGFEGTETASRALFKEQATTLDGPALTLDDAEKLCAFARFCDNGGSIWNQMAETDNPEVNAAVIHEGTHCPSGRLVLHRKSAHHHEASHDQTIEPKHPQSIGIVEDPAQQCSGPLWVRGGIPVVSHDGYQYEVRNRVTLCRCGESRNKPVCDGTHAAIKFRDD
jgi:CDGSH-type Zn-finger protein